MKNKPFVETVIQTPLTRDEVIKALQPHSLEINHPKLPGMKELFNTGDFAPFYLCLKSDSFTLIDRTNDLRTYNPFLSCNFEENKPENKIHIMARVLPSVLKVEIALSIAMILITLAIYMSVTPPLWLAMAATTSMALFPILMHYTGRYFAKKVTAKNVQKIKTTLVDYAAQPHRN